MKQNFEKSLLDTAIRFKTDYLELASWKKWLFSLVIEHPKGVISIRAKKADPNLSASEKARKLLEKMKKVKYDDDIAIEVLNFRKDLVNYGGKTYKLSHETVNDMLVFSSLFIFLESSVTRSPRPSFVRLRVGQVVKHTKLHFYGVIVGWDARAQVSNQT